MTHFQAVSHGERPSDSRPLNDISADPGQPFDLADTQSLLLQKMKRHIPFFFRKTVQ